LERNETKRNETFSSLVEDSYVAQLFESSATPAFSKFCALLQEATLGVIRSSRRDGRLSLLEVRPQNGRNGRGNSARRQRLVGRRAVVGNLEDGVVEGTVVEDAVVLVVQVTLVVERGEHVRRFVRELGLVVQVVELLPTPRGCTLDEELAHVVAADHPVGRHGRDGEPQPDASLVDLVEDPGVEPEDDLGAGHALRHALDPQRLDVPVVPLLERLRARVVLPVGAATVPGHHGVPLVGPGFGLFGVLGVREREDHHEQEAREKKGRSRIHHYCFCFFNFPPVYDVCCSLIVKNNSTRKKKNFF